MGRQWERATSTTLGKWSTAPTATSTTRAALRDPTADSAVAIFSGRTTAGSTANATFQTTWHTFTPPPYSIGPLNGLRANRSTCLHATPCALHGLTNEHG